MVRIPFVIIIIRNVLGEKVSFTGKSLKPNTEKQITVSITDNFGNVFKNSQKKWTDLNGTLQLHADDLQDLISSSSPNNPSGFILQEFDKTGRKC